MLVEIIGKRNQEEIVTTSRKIAEVFKREHKSVIRAIENLKTGVTAHFYADHFNKVQYKDSQNKTQFEYVMDRDGFSLLVMGFTGEKALKWKMDYIDAFNSMENELKRIYTERQQWEIEREKGKLVRHILTDTIKMKVADSPNKKFMYPNYTKLIYKLLFNKSFKELKEEYGIKPKESLRDYLPSEQLKEVEHMEMLVSSLINLGWDYQQIKDFISTENNKMIA